MLAKEVVSFHVCFNKEVFHFERLETFQTHSAGYGQNLIMIQEIGRELKGNRNRDNA